MREAEEIDRAIQRHERDGVEIADDGVVFDRLKHCAQSLSQPQRRGVQSEANRREVGSLALKTNGLSSANMARGYPKRAPPASWFLGQVHGSSLAGALPLRVHPAHAIPKALSSLPPFTFADAVVHVAAKIRPSIRRHRPVRLEAKHRIHQSIVASVDNSVAIDIPLFV